MPEWPVAVVAKTRPMKAGFANVPKLDESCVIIGFDTYLIPPKPGDKQGIWLEVFELTYLNRNGFEQIYTWSEER